jgi:hypothetical protein
MTLVLHLMISSLDYGNTPQASHKAKTNVVNQRHEN